MITYPKVELYVKLLSRNVCFMLKFDIDTFIDYKAENRYEKYLITSY